MQHRGYEKTGAGWPFRFLEKFVQNGDERSPLHLLGVVLNGMALEVNLGTFWKKALTTFATALIENITTSLGGHAGAEAVLLLAGAF